MKRSGVVRPWDKKRPAHGRGRRATSAPPPTNDDGPEIPHVMIDGVRYDSDRFYLHKTAYQNDTKTEETNAEAAAAACTCGARQPPALFDRQALVASLDLQCAILATYTLDKRWLASAFPSLMGPDATVPTLVLHGKLDPRDRFAKENNQNHDGDDEKSSQASSNFMEESPPIADRLEECPASTYKQKGDDDDDLSICTQPEMEQVSVSFAASPPPANEPYSTPEALIPEHVRFTQIAPTWLPPPNMADIVLQRRVQRERKRGKCALASTVIETDRTVSTDPG